MQRIFRLEPDNTAAFNALFTIYEEAIPANERKSREDLRKLVLRDDYAMFCLEQDRKVTGFAILYLSSVTGVGLLEYMAVDNRFRNSGAGSGLLSLLFTGETLGSRCTACLVEVDAPGPEHPDNTIRQRRQNFYRRNGCLLLKGFKYILPLPSAGPPADMELMAFFPGGSEPVGRTRLEEWLRDIYLHVYGCNQFDPRITAMLDRFPGEPVFE